MGRIVVLISGRGSNLEAIIGCAQRERWSHQIVAVVADRRLAPGLAFAERWKIPTIVVERADYPDREAFEQVLLQQLLALNPDVIALAGFLRVLGAALIERFAHRWINIHPSLLPAFPGLQTHRRALQAGVRVHGATVHLVTAALDAGPILAQAVVPVLPEDTETSLGQRVLLAEHQIFPRAIAWLADGRVRLRDGVLQWQGVDAGERLLGVVA
jgi:phosphoribosylglycinamide formyltransferase-1